MAASPGAAKGHIVFTADAAVAAAAEGTDVILVRPFTEADDVAGFHAAKGILTSEGGKASHAALVARGMGRPAVTGAAAVHVDLHAGVIHIGDLVLHEGDLIAIDGSTGAVTTGDVPLVAPQVDPHFETVLGWCDELRTLGVRANADTPEDARRARGFGAEGVGLCRTEHMFMAADRQPKMQAMIMADDEAGRRAALDELLPMQQADFEGVFEAMDGLPVTIRLLDPPLHEFLPDREAVVEHLTEARVRGNGEVAELEHVLERMRALDEGNPMLGTRGVRLGLLHPEIYEMQARAIFRAARAVAERTGHAPVVEVMIPLVAYTRELERRARAGRARRRRGGRRGRRDRHDDRAAAGVPEGGRDRRARATSSRSARTTSPRPGSASRATTSKAGSCRSTRTSASSSARRSGRSTPRASASSSRSRWSGGGPPSPSSRPACAASTGETRARSASSTPPGSTT